MSLGIYWHQIKRFTAHKLVTSMYVWLLVVPIVARALERAPDVVQLDTFLHPVEIQLMLPFSWVVFYFSALSFVCANLVYLLFCPSIVKENRDYAEFRASGKGVEHLDRYIFDVDMNWERLRQIIERRDEYFEEIAEVSNPKSEDGLLRKRFTAAFIHADERKLWARCASAALLMIGGLLAVFVMVQNVLFVIQYLGVH